MSLDIFRQLKAGGKESDELVLQDIASYVIDEMDDEIVVMGSGSTTAFIMEELALENTLLGVDVVHQQEVVKNDITEPELWQLLEENSDKPIKLIITLIGGQGHIFGRGNQQLSPRIIRKIGKEQITIVATKAKLVALENRPLIVDTGDNELDQELSGYLPVTTGYRDQVLYPVASPQ